MVDSDSARFLTPSDVARLLRVSRWTVRRWVKAGMLPAVRLGTAANSPIRFDPEDVARFVARPIGWTGHD